MPTDRTSPSAGWREVAREFCADGGSAADEEPAEVCPDCGSVLGVEGGDLCCELHLLRRRGVVRPRRDTTADVDFDGDRNVERDGYVANDSNGERDDGGE